MTAVKLRTIVSANSLDMVIILHAVAIDASTNNPRACHRALQQPPIQDSEAGTTMASKLGKRARATVEDRDHECEHNHQFLAL